MARFVMLLIVGLVIPQILGRRARTRWRGSSLSSELQEQFCGQIERVCFNGALYERCGGSLCYGEDVQTPATQACCEGIWDGTHESSASSTSSASSMEYRPTTPTESAPQTIACCGTETYNTTLEQCCDDGHVGTDCCGGVAYNSAILSCCSEGNIGLHCCGDIAYDDASLMCCNGIQLGGSCCGDIAYDNTVLSCCSDGNLGAECCGGIAYNSATSQCCSEGSIATNCCGGLGDGDSSLQCCRIGDLGPQCCGGVAYASADLECCDSIVFDPSSLKCCDDGSVGPACCGDYGYNDASFKCCSSGNVGVECCGVTGYDPAVLPANTACCAGVFYDTTVSLCCNGIQYSLTPIDTLLCCVGGCCPSGDAVYDGREYLCCGSDFVNRNMESSKECCLGTIYDTEIYFCEDGWVKPFLDVGSTAWFRG